MYKSKHLLNTIAILAAALAWTSAIAEVKISYSGATCQHASQGDTLLPQNVQYSSFGGISNHSKKYSITVSCPIPHLHDIEDGWIYRNNTWIHVYYEKSPDASKEAVLACTLYERTKNGDFIQSDTDADSHIENEIINVHLEGLKFDSVLVMQCRLPSHGSRIRSYAVRSQMQSPF